ncbi:hypothetical protein O3M35_006643 [Rhynocoris fuscipes]|uniref:Uncharacterized protein n=1 Tax=Rhynocoris fuscipes TaxID=488301 RepID=A0AAW1DGS4_9HEMI
MIILTWLFYFTLPPVIDIIIYFTGYEMRTFTLPLPLSGYLEKDPPRSLKNSLLLAFSIFWSIISFSGHVGSIGTFFSLIMYTHAILQIFNLSVDRLNFSKEHENESLTKIINMHQNIIRLDESLKEVYGLGFLLQNLMISICICMCLFTVSNTEDKVMITAYIFGLLYYGSLSIVCCFLGQLIENESDKMLVTISNIPWVDMSPNIRKDLILILLQSSRMIEISFKGYSPLNFNTLMAIFNTTYSYFTLLQSVA